MNQEELTKLLNYLIDAFKINKWHMEYGNVLIVIDMFINSKPLHLYMCKLNGKCIRWCNQC